MTPGSFFSWKIPFIKENVKHSQTERVKDAINKQILLNILEVEVLFWTFDISSVVMILWR